MEAFEFGESVLFSWDVVWLGEGEMMMGRGEGGREGDW